MHIQRLLDQYVDDGRLAGAAAAIYKSGVGPISVFAGTLAYDSNVNADQDTIFRIASLTKPITALAALIICDSNDLSLDSPINDFIPEFNCVRVRDSAGSLQSPSGAITVRHLLTHTSGTGHFSNFPMTNSLDELVLKIVELELAWEPGTVWDYGMSFEILGLLLERIAAKPLDEIIRSIVTEPLKMADTAFSIRTKDVHRLCSQYEWVREQLYLTDSAESTVYVRPGVMPSGGGGLVSTVRDYAKFCESLLFNRNCDGTTIFPSHLIDLYSENLLPTSVRPDGLKGRHFGPGVAINTELSAQGRAEPAGTFGWRGASGTFMLVDPIQKTFGILMTQLAPAYKYPIKDEFCVAWYKDLHNN